MFNAGWVRPGSKVWIPVNTFDSNDPSASVTATTWLNTDCHVHKDGGTTQRASSAGETLSIDFDTVTGNHLLEIDTADNTTANFYEAGSFYSVRMEGVTVDAGNINAWIGCFWIGYPDAIVNTTIATLASQTSFTLEEGSADNDAYNGMWCIVHDLASAVQVARGVISDYVGATKTVTLIADPGIFTMAAGDSISIMGPMPLQPTTLGRTLDVTATGAAGIDWGNVENPTTAVDLSATDIQLCDTVTTLTGHTAQTGDSFARLGAPAGASVSADIAAIEAQTDDIGVAGAGLTAIPWNADWDAEVESEVTDALVADGLDHLVSAAVVGTDVADNSILAKLVSKSATADWDDFVNTTDSLQNIRDELVTVDANVDSILDDTGTSGVAVANGAITSAKFGAGAVDAAALAADAVDEILDEQIGDGTLTMREALRVCISALAGKLSGAATTTVTIRNDADTQDVIVATVDADGNRSAVTLTP